MIRENRFPLSIIVLLFLSSLPDCSGGDPVVSLPATSTATVNGLEPNTLYYFAVSAYNGQSGLCSNEVSTVTPPSGTVFLIWNSVQDSTVTAYDVHYGKLSAGQPASCAYTDVIRVP